MMRDGKGLAIHSCECKKIFLLQKLFRHLEGIETFLTLGRQVHWRWVRFLIRNPPPKTSRTSYKTFSSFDRTVDAEKYKT